jgi:hypothetical protein
MNGTPITPHQRELLMALWSLKSDAEFAWKQLLEGDERGLENVGVAMKRLEQLAIEGDQR